MSFDLTNEEKLALVQQRLKSFYAEKYQHELNAKTATELGNEAAVEDSNGAVAALEKAIAIHLEELNAL